MSGSFWVCSPLLPSCGPEYDCSLASPVPGGLELRDFFFETSLSPRFEFVVYL